MLKKGQDQSALRNRECIVHLDAMESGTGDLLTTSGGVITRTNIYKPCRPRERYNMPSPVYLGQTALCYAVPDALYIGQKRARK